MQTDLEPLAALPTVPFLQWTAAVPFPGYAISDLPISPVLLYRVGVLSLDIMILLLNYIAPQSYLRPFLSTVLASIELLDGRWKAALLSAAGIFSSRMIAPGFFMKMGLGIVDLMPSDLQDEVAWMTYRSIKSIVVGFAVEVFLMVAPVELRNKVKDVLGNAATITVRNNELLASAGLPPQPSTSTAFKASSVQGIITDTAIICSQELQALVPLIKESVILEFIAQLAGLPTSVETLAHTCKTLFEAAVKEKYHDYSHLFAARGLSKLVNKAVKEGAYMSVTRAGAATEAATIPVAKTATAEEAATAATTVAATIPVAKTAEAKAEAKAATTVAAKAEAAKAATTNLATPVLPPTSEVVLSATRQQQAVTSGGRRLRLKR
jgi:hypothetical protein